MSARGNAVAPSELTPDVFLCIGCGAQVSFDDAESGTAGTLLARATCPYCEVVNDRSFALLRKKAAQERHEALLRAERLRRARLWTGAGVLAVLGLLLLAAANTSAGLRELHAEVDRAQAQVVNVRERQVAVAMRFGQAEVGIERDAELSGAENRVRIERARYDEAAAAYNVAAGSLWARLCAAPFHLPERVPLSNEAHW